MQHLILVTIPALALPTLAAPRLDLHADDCLLMQELAGYDLGPTQSDVCASRSQAVEAFNLAGKAHTFHDCVTLPVHAGGRAVSLRFRVPATAPLALSGYADDATPDWQDDGSVLITQAGEIAGDVIFTNGQRYSLQALLDFTHFEGLTLS